MSIASNCDHHGVVYRAIAVLRDELQDTVPVWTPLDAPAGLNCRAFQNYSGTQVDHGPGQQQGTTRKWILVKTFDVQEQDILRITEGQEAPLQLRVLSVDRLTNPTALHHYEIVGEVNTDVLDEEGES